MSLYNQARQPGAKTHAAPGASRYEPQALLPRCSTRNTWRRTPHITTHAARSTQHAVRSVNLLKAVPHKHHQAHYTHHAAALIQLQQEMEAHTRHAKK
jgi:hypothetical protein